MELAIRGYLDEPRTITPQNWPVAWAPAYAEAVTATLRTILEGALAFARA